ncbi:MAG: hypothetical protein A2355_05145 [Spirochaetes bacterium RIFOXYB1_FULL_32_8]|nr:MAG: hypothetical protein A2355_05145 [Spirochaetes bacterium RIFOXYB1_FULL_32_8]
MYLFFLENLKIFFLMYVNWDWQEGIRNGTCTINWENPVQIFGQGTSYKTTGRFLKKKRK